MRDVEKMVESGDEHARVVRDAFIFQLAKDIGVLKVRVVANKVRDENDKEFIRSRIPAEDLLGFMSYNADVIDADRRGLSPYDCSTEAVDEVRAIKAVIDSQE